MLGKQELLGRLEAFIHDPWASDGDIEDVFLELMAEDLLKTGHEQFGLRGRGAIVFDVRGLLGWRRGDMPTMYYLTYQDLVTAGHTSETTEAEIAEYDPDREVPVLFVYDRGISGHVVTRSWGMRANKG